MITSIKVIVNRKINALKLIHSKSVMETVMTKGLVLSATGYLAKI